jgi:N-methylhydantoinase B
VLEDASLSLLSDRRRHDPAGAKGGEAGRRGENRLNDTELPPKTGRELKPGDVITVRTPGGGGYGKDPSSSD